MRARKLLALILAIALAGAGVAACGGGSGGGPSKGRPPAPEQAFLQSMMPHHDSAVEMAKVAGAEATTPFVNGWPQISSAARRARSPRCGESTNGSSAPALAHLRSDYGIGSIFCGGPSLNATFVAEGLVDELFLSVPLGARVRPSRSVSDGPHRGVAA